MKTEHFDYIVNYFQLDQYYEHNSTWLSAYADFCPSRSIISPDRTDDAKGLWTVGNTRCQLWFNLPFDVANQVRNLLIDTELLFT